MNCLKCDVNMASEGYIQDAIQLCHACYEIEFTDDVETISWSSSNPTGERASNGLW